MESGEQGIGREVSPRRKLSAMVFFLVTYTAYLALAMFGNWQSRWLKPDAALMGCLLTGTYLELFVLDGLRRSMPSWLLVLGAMLAYLIPPAAIDQYRFIDRFPPAMREQLPPPLWNPAYTLAFGIVAYIALVFRAIWIFRSRPPVLGTHRA